MATKQKYEQDMQWLLDDIRSLPPDAQRYVIKERMKGVIGKIEKDGDLQNNDKKQMLEDIYFHFPFVKNSNQKETSR